jgi:hypothetical protein
LAVENLNRERACGRSVGQAANLRLAPTSGCSGSAAYRLATINNLGNGSSTEPSASSG